ncbi:MAG TPA: RHS repeat-associated core domain-containing protein, partial [Polyangia bacterium]|nr:RHS repeat-associated core domain-containing protein [Polyangia bacterium]
NDEFDSVATPTTATFTYTGNGAMKRMAHLQVIEWDYADRMRHASKGGGGDVFFTYDGGGQRVRKVWVKTGSIDERIYVGGWETFRQRTGAMTSTPTFQRETLHVMDDKSRVAMVETKTIGGPPTGPRWRFQLTNLLGSSTMELDAQGRVITSEEYHPYGSTAFQSSGSSEVSPKRYRYTGKEKDEETGLYYYGARYYVPWLGRWTAPDPAGHADGLNLYQFCRNSPVSRQEMDGSESISAAELKAVSAEARKLGTEGLQARAEEMRKRVGLSPRGARTKAAKYYDKGGQLRLTYTLTSIGNYSAGAGKNLARIGSLLPDANQSLALITTAREHGVDSVSGRGTASVETYGEGGLDYLMENKRRLGLPESVTKNWEPGLRLRNPESKLKKPRRVNPAFIPGEDQLLGYAAQTRLSFKDFESFVRETLGNKEGNEALAGLNEEAKLTWEAYAFLRPYGEELDLKKKKTQAFGVRTAFELLVAEAKKEGRAVNLNEVLTNVDIAGDPVVRKSKARAAETLIFNTILDTVRQQEKDRSAPVQPAPR